MLDMVGADAVGAGIVVNHRMVVFGVSRRLGFGVIDRSMGCTDRFAHHRDRRTTADQDRQNKRGSPHQPTHDPSIAWHQHVNVCANLSQFGSPQSQGVPDDRH
jgi:hypothetical protein